MVTLPALLRKGRQLLADPALRTWLVGRMTGRYPAPPIFTVHRPPYVDQMLPLQVEPPSADHLPVFTPPVEPGYPFEVALPGLVQNLDPAAPAIFFDTPCTDIETELARHRFAWLPLVDAVPAGWFTSLWSIWRERFMDTDGWHWHPYTAAERVVNILDGVRRFGTPADTGELTADLARHAPKIADQLEYFGPHDTFNHLANNGRGLYRLGCALSLPKARALGFEILRHEAAQIFLPGGTLREGSTHYHSLYVRNYLDVWLAALRHGYVEQAVVLQETAARLLGAAKTLVLPGGLPLIGDISPDCPPAFLAGIADGVCAWTATLAAADQDRVRALANTVSAVGIETLQGDGWLRADHGRWSALASAPAAGWPFIPGHAHQDLGSAEVHLDGAPLFVDPGRGAYGESGDAALYRSATIHGTLRIDDSDPYPPNKPYYTDPFRAHVAGPAAIARHDDGFTLTHGGYRRLGVETVQRRWRFAANGMRIEDTLSERGRHRLERALVTPLAVAVDGNTAIVDGRVRVRADGIQPRLDPVTVWGAYGVGAPGTRIVFETTQNLPWSGTIDIEVIA